MKLTWLFSLLTFLLITPEGSAQPVGADGKLSDSQKRQLIILAQDVVSVGVEREFENGTLSDEALILFAINQVALRRRHLFRKDKVKGAVKLAAKFVTDGITRSFGQPVKHHSIKDWNYRAGYYNGLYEPILEPAPINRLEIYGVGKGYLTLHVEHIDLLATTDAGRNVIARTMLMLKKIMSKGRHHYILSAYRRLPPKP